MRRCIFLFLGVLFALLLPSFALAQEEWTIDSFHSDIVIHEDGSMTVTEVIDVEFFAQRRGIFREIPLRSYDEYRQANSIEVDIISVRNQLGGSWQYTESRSGGYLTLRIGNPNIYLTGKHEYQITYEVHQALGFFEDHDEIYWDVTGNDWEVPIATVSAAVTLPETFNGEAMLACYTGAFGSREQDCRSSQLARTVSFEANDFLTIIVGWPKGIVHEPTFTEKLWHRLKNNWGYGLPVMTFMLMYLIWRRHGKDPQDPPGLVTQFEPPDDLTPVEVGYLMESTLKNDFLPAELVHLASKGYIHIREDLGKKGKKDDEYILIKKKAFTDANLKQHQKLLLNALFLKKDERKISDIPASFTYKVSEIKSQLYKQLSEKKYFANNPTMVKVKWIVLSIAVGFAALPTLGTMRIHYFVGLLLSAIVIFIFAFFMPKRTQAGVLALEHAKGFEKYISIAEDRRVKWEEERNLFFQFLPYAMVFGLAEKWAKAFEGVFQEAPEWFEGDVTNLSSTTFARNMNLFSAATTSHIIPPASSRSGSSSFSSGSSGFSGGGFSGGGGGGGGGGSW